MFKNCIKKCDLFSKQFVFQVGESKDKKTFLGGCFSFTIIVVSGFYLYYLVYLYATNQVTPKNNVMKQVQTSRFNIPVKEDIVAFDFKVAGESLNTYQNRTNKTYFTLSTYKDYYPPYTGVRESEQKSLRVCSDSQFKGYYCLGTTELDSFFMDPITTEGSVISIRLDPCDSTLYTNCATDEELINFNNYQNYLQIFLKVKTFNESTMQFEEQIYFEYYYIDINTYTYSRLSLIKGQAEVTHGAFIQESETTVVIQEYKKIDNFMQMKNSQRRMNMASLTYIVLEPNQEIQIMQMQYPMITEILAQSMSVFNSLLIIGFALRLLANSYIYDDLSVVLLKNYYKKTALKIIDQNEKQKNISSAVSREAYSLENIQDTIESTNFRESGSNLFKGGFIKRCALIFTSIFGERKKNKSYQNQEQEIYNKLLTETSRNLNIYKLYAEILRLKMAVKLIFTKEQYAAFFFCGSDIIRQEDQNMFCSILDERKPVSLRDIDADAVNEDQFEELPNINQNAQMNNANQNEILLNTTSNINNSNNLYGLMRLSSLKNLDAENDGKQLKKAMDIDFAIASHQQSFAEKQEIAIKNLYGNSPALIPSNQLQIDHSFDNQSSQRRNKIQVNSCTNKSDSRLLAAEIKKLSLSKGDNLPVCDISDDLGDDDTSKIENKDSPLEPYSKKLYQARQDNHRQTHQSQIQYKINQPNDASTRGRLRFTKSQLSQSKPGETLASKNTQNGKYQNQELFSHKLKEMDDIEEIKHLRFDYAKQFLSRMNGQNLDNINWIDKNIYENLIFDKISRLTSLKKQNKSQEVKTLDRQQDKIAIPQKEKEPLSNQDQTQLSKGIKEPK